MENTSLEMVTKHKADIIAFVSYEIKLKVKIIERNRCSLHTDKFSQERITVMHLKCSYKTVEAQIGRIMRQLKDKKLLLKT